MNDCPSLKQSLADYLADYSIIFPSRQRTQKLGNLLDSIAKTAHDISRVEVLVAVDFDDDETMRWIAAGNGGKQHEWVVYGRWPFAKFLVRDRASNFSEQYYTWLYKQSTGRYVQALNDDVVFMTPRWDEIAVSLLDAAKAKHPDGAVYGRCGDGYGAMYACFPVLSREAVDAQGWFFHPGFTAWGADIHLYRIWATLGRVVDLPFDVDHVAYHTHAEEKPDEVHLRMKNLSKFAHDTVGVEVKRIKAALKERQATIE